MPPLDAALRLERAFTCDPANLSVVSVLDGGARLLTAGRDGVLLWELATGERLATFQSRTGSVSRVIGLDDGRFLLAGDSLAVMELDAGTEHALQAPWFRRGMLFAVSADGARTLSSPDRTTIELRDLASGTVIASREPLLGTISGPPEEQPGLSCLGYDRSHDAFYAEVSWIDLHMYSASRRDYYDRTNLTHLGTDDQNHLEKRPAGLWAMIDGARVAVGRADRKLATTEAHDGGVALARILLATGTPRLISAWGDGTIRIWALTEPEAP